MMAIGMFKYKKALIGGIGTGVPDHPLKKEAGKDGIKMA